MLWHINICLKKIQLVFFFVWWWSFFKIVMEITWVIHTYIPNKTDFILGLEEKEQYYYVSDMGCHFLFNQIRWQGQFACYCDRYYIFPNLFFPYQCSSFFFSWRFSLSRTFTLCSVGIQHLQYLPFVYLNWTTFL